MLRKSDFHPFRADFCNTQPTFATRAFFGFFFKNGFSGGDNKKMNTTKTLFSLGKSMYVNTDNEEEGSSMPILLVSIGDYYALQNKSFTEPVYSTSSEEGETAPFKSLPEGEYTEIRPKFII